MTHSQFRLAGVMGWPISHSRSPILHGYWLQRYGISGAYVPLAVRPDRLEIAIRALPSLGFAGCNLTVPHKIAALPILDHLDPAAREMGSVNTIIVRPDGSLEGRSTDGYGFMASLAQSAPDWQAATATVLVIGAGGAARAIVAALRQAGVSRLRLVNRTDARSVALALDFNLDLGTVFWPWAERQNALAGCDLVINTTTQGMVGQAPLDLDLGALPVPGLVADIVYTPLETPLLADARARGHRVIDGLGMLLHQARPGFAAWFGRDPEVDDGLRAAVLQSLRA